jgi:micrococcal nuclease
MQNLFSKYQSLNTKQQVLTAVAIFILGLVVLPNVVVYGASVYASYKLIEEKSFRRFFVAIFSVVTFFSFVLLFDDGVSEPTNTASQGQESEQSALNTTPATEIETSTEIASSSEQGEVAQANTENQTSGQDTATTEQTSNNTVNEASGNNRYKVTSVVDGDTLKLDINGTTETIRLIGIDTPETVHPSQPVECMGIEASNEAKRLLTGQTVRFESDNTQDTRDRYGRLLGYVFLPNGDNYGEVMLRSGYANEYTYSSAYKYQSAFKSAEQTARNNKAGLWADGACVEETATEPTTSTPTQTIPTASTGEKWYVSSHHTSKFYYCEDSNGWQGLSETYLEVYASEAALKADYPNHTLHESCQ